uniref:CSON005154 protein n=1 Tax=Culicoides sonorensis TaxID=179676 RepID=A0A336L9G3_CULSO
MSTLAISNADVQSAPVNINNSTSNNRNSESLSDKLSTATSITNTPRESLATISSQIESIYSEIAEGDAISTSNTSTTIEKPINVVSERMMLVQSTVKTITNNFNSNHNKNKASRSSSSENNNKNNNNESSRHKFLTPNNTTSRQRVSAVKVTLPPGGVKGAQVKNSKINAPPGLNYVFDAHPNINKHHHHDYRYGPHFETGNVTNITVQAGSTFYLHCRISLLLDKTVSWVHRRQGQTALQLLTVGKQTYSGDSRYTIDFQYPNNWRLKIESVIKDDEGVYECQVSTHPPRIITYHLHVNDPKILIVDEAGIPLLDKYVQVDSTIKLACIVRHISMTSSVVFWMHGSTILNYDTTRGGISVKTDLKDFGANSTLFVAKVNQSDSGNYTCSIGPHQYYMVTVHVLNESLAELHHSSSSSSIHSPIVHQILCQYLLFSALFITTILCMSNNNLEKRKSITVANRKPINIRNDPDR